MSLKVENLTVSYYQDVFVLEDVFLEAQEKKLTAILGPNGAGKSTLLRTIYGFLVPKKGRVFLDGQDITGWPPYEMLGAGMAYILQERGLFPNLTVQENLQLGAWLFRDDKIKVRQKIDEIYQRYPILRQRLGVKAGALSGGEQRLLEMGRALMNSPRICLFDEPSAGLAPKVAAETYGEIIQLKEEGRTILLVEQNIRQALSVADYVYVLELGKVKFGGPKDQIDLRQAGASWIKI